MKVTSIQVTAARTFNHPFEQYSNLRPEITMAADLQEGEDPIAAARELQRLSETLVEDHKRAMLQSIEELQEMTQRQAEMQRLGDTIAAAQKRVDEVRAKYPALHS